MKPVFWKNLAQEKEEYSHSGNQYGLIHIWTIQNKSAVLSYYFDKEKKHSTLLDLLKGMSGLRAKVIGTKAIVNEVKPLLLQAGIQIEKSVEREGDFCLKYLAKEQKILLERATTEVKPKDISIHEKEASTKYKVMIVDDSVTIRKILQNIFSKDPDLEVVASIEKPSEAIAAIEKFKPDVITLDIHMPEMDGVELLKKYLPIYRVPTVMVSALSMEDGPYVLNALEAGAVDYIQKPSASDMESAIPMIISKVKAAAAAKVKLRSTALLKKAESSADIDPTKIIVIGSSTGGTEALKELFLRLPEKIPPILVVQHIPAVFSKALADRLNSLCPFEVKEAQDGDRLKPNCVLIAPGGLQMRIKSLQNDYAVIVDDSEPVNRHKPSVDYLFHSVAKVVGKKAVGVILTGMGADGAKGLLAMRELGSVTFGQDEETCVVYGMPQAAMKIGAVQTELPLLEIPSALMEEVKRKKIAA